MGMANVFVEPPLALKFWEETEQPKWYMARWGMAASPWYPYDWKWLG